MAKAIIWIRTSTEEQEVDTQRTLLTEKAKKEGFREEDLVYIGSAGASAIKMNELYQREVNELIAKIQTEPEITTVYVWEVSRLARNELAFHQMKDVIIGHRIQLICDVPSIKLLDANGDVNDGAELSLNLLVTLAKQEMNIKKKRMSRGKKRLAEQGKYNGGAIPYGYRIDKQNDNMIVEDEEEGKIVREIFELYESGVSQPSIAKELFSRGVKGRAARKTKNFTISLVHQILTNKLLTGEPHKSKGASYVRQYPQIITPEQFEKCRRIAEMNNTVLPKTQRVYYAHQLIECTACKRRFISTGNKGCYHCRDAYNYNKRYDGYDGVPMCPNRVCISINILDSLLWKLAIKYETFFILNEATERIAMYDSRIRVLREKLDNIPARLQTIEGYSKKLNNTYVFGADMPDDEYQEYLAKIRKDKSQVQRDKAQYIREIKQFDALKEQAGKALEFDYQVDKFANKAQAIYNKVATITDDHERYAIIHRHIEKVTVEKTTITQTFAIHPDGKEVTAKRITVYPFGKEPEVYYYVPNDGKGGRMLSYQDYEVAYMYLDDPYWKYQGRILDKYPTPTMLPFEMTYLPRMRDEGKYQRRELARAKREEIQHEAIDKLRKKGYISMAEMREISGLSYSAIYDAIKHGRLKGENRFKTWYSKKSDFTTYLDKYNPKPRPAGLKRRASQEQLAEQGKDERQ